MQKMIFDYKKAVTWLKNKNFLFIAGLIGILLVLSADGCVKRENTPDAAAGQEKFDKQSYVILMENQLMDIISNIDGAGSVKVMVTLESSEQIVYACAEKTDTDFTQNGTESFCERSSYENDYIMIEDGSGGRKALKKTVLEPEIKGVAVICSGGDNIMVQKRIVETISTLLDIPTNRICVTKMT